MTTRAILDCFKDLSVLVVGDICLDHWCRYDPDLSEPSRETGIPRLAVVASETTPGAAGTVTNNLAALGAGRVALLGAVGQDGFGFELMRSLSVRRVDADLIVRVPDWPTFTYTKLINNHTGIEDRPRVDFIATQRPPEQYEEELCRRVRDFAGSFDVVIVSDQAETEAGGVVSPLVREELCLSASRHPDTVFWVDSRRRIEHFRGCILKPNHDEANAACQRLFGAPDYRRLRDQAQAPVLIVTCGKYGAKVVTEHAETPVSTREVENPVDICGAGDSFSAGGALAYAVTRSALDAARVGNLVSSVTIMKPGTGTALPEEVLAAELP